MRRRRGHGPGDAIFADENGILVLPPAEIEAAATRAIGMQNAEKQALRRVDAGEKYPDIIGSTAIIEQHLVAR